MSEVAMVLPRVCDTSAGWAYSGERLLGPRQAEIGRRPAHFRAEWPVPDVAEVVAEWCRRK
jgi:hypothetical protein